jgi:hypothetical protein
MGAHILDSMPADLYTQIHHNQPFDDKRLQFYAQEFFPIRRVDLVKTSNRICIVRPNEHGLTQVDPVIPNIMLQDGSVLIIGRLYENTINAFANIRDYGVIHSLRLCDDINRTYFKLSSYPQE